MPPKRTASKPNKSGAGGKKKKTAALYKLPERIPSGHVVTDVVKQEWVFHDSIGIGGFGEIYNASAKKKSSGNVAHLYAIKVEPKENGPLFTEMHFYMRVAKAELIEAWKKEKKLKSLGMPVYHGFGSFELNSNSYRFLVIDKLSQNLQDILNENNKQFPCVTSLQIAVQVLDVLEYIHSKGYIHGDIKAANLMLGAQPGTENTVHVIDFGLATKCAGSDKEYPNNPDCANNGTMLYISRDGHVGVFGFRGDVEILCYNLLHWLNGSLPWEKDVDNASVVLQKKTDFMLNPKAYCQTDYPQVPAEVIELIVYVASLKNNSVPDYNFCRDLLIKKLKKLKCTSPYQKLVFTGAKDSSKSGSPLAKKKLKSASKPKPLKKPNISNAAKSAAAKSPVGKSPAKSPALKSPAAKTPGVLAAGSRSLTPAVITKGRALRKRKMPVAVSNDQKASIAKVKKSSKTKVETNADEGPTTSTAAELNEAIDLIESNSDEECVLGSANRKSVRRSSIKLPIKKKAPIAKNRLKDRKSKENIPSKGRNTKIGDNNKPSWRDDPAVKASNVKRAGEYTKTKK